MPLARAHYVADLLGQISRDYTRSCTFTEVVERESQCVEEIGEAAPVPQVEARERVVELSAEQRLFAYALFMAALGLEPYVPTRKTVKAKRTK